MPQVHAQGKTVVCEEGTNLRQILLQQGIDLHNNQSRLINCRGLGTCGTCAVQVEGAVSIQGWRERARLSLPPHSPTKDRRLACQTQVLGSLRVMKYDGFWGQGDRPVWTPEG
ncbi:MAG: 2Fe-2S iron-sulfur cluster-binding protein [Cyanobacteriota bacterium]